MRFCLFKSKKKDRITHNFLKRVNTVIHWNDPSCALIETPSYQKLIIINVHIESCQFLGGRAWAIWARPKLTQPPILNQKKPSPIVNVKLPLLPPYQWTISYACASLPLSPKCLHQLKLHPLPACLPFLLITQRFRPVGTFVAQALLGSQNI